MEEDVTYRAYDLLDRASRGRMLLALDRLSLRGDELNVSIAECRQQLANRGLELPDADVQQCLLEWYVWDRIIKGECRHWKHR